MDFFFLVLLNAVLYVRPGEWLLELLPFHPYEVVIVSCLLLGIQKVLPQLTARSMAENPVTACVVALFVTTVFCELVRFRLGTAGEAAEDLAKTLVYYLLLVGVVDTPNRLRSLLRWFVASGVLILVLAVLHYKGVLDLPNMTVTVENPLGTPDPGDEPIYIRRLGTTSLLGDPNDCALFIDHCILICLYLVWDGGGRAAVRALWLAPMAFCGYALALTQSRGGLVSLASGLAAYMVGRYGRKAVVYGSPLALAGLVVLAGRNRQADISLGGGTGLQRVQLWAEYYGFFRGNPVLGVGWKVGPDLARLQAHNSFLQGYGEQGFLAGTLFVGAFYLAFRSFGPLLTPPGPSADPVLSRLRPCLLAVVVSQIVGMMGLTRNLSLPTYTVLGLAAVYARLAGVHPPLPTGERLARHLLGASVLFLIVMWFMIKFNLKYA